MKQIAYFCYHRKDDNMLETCINSLRKSNPACEIIIATDGVPLELSRRFAGDYDAKWIYVAKESMVRRRATCKIETLHSIMYYGWVQEGDVILVSDVDVYFRSDPFQAVVENPDMDLGLTTRGYQHAFPINGGIFYIKVNAQMKDWVSWHVEQIHKPTWEPYVQHRKRWNHERYGFDWSVGQDFLVANWVKKEKVFVERGVKIVDVGPRYNFCPPTDVIGKTANQQVRNAMKDSDIVVVHLKSQLKEMIYQDSAVFPHVKLNYPKGNLAWL